MTKIGAIFFAKTPAYIAGAENLFFSYSNIPFLGQGGLFPTIGSRSRSADQVNNRKKNFQKLLSSSINSEKTLGVNFPCCFRGVNPSKPHHTNFEASSLYKRYVLQIFLTKSANTVHSRVQNNLQLAIQGCHCQLDDQCRGPSIKEKDHLAG